MNAHFVPNFAKRFRSHKRASRFLAAFVACATFMAVFLYQRAQAAAPLLVEDFSYTAATALTANGWAAHSAGGTNAITVVAPGLTYAGYPSSGVGNAVSMVTNGEDDNKTFATQTTGTVYAAFMVNVSAASTVATGDYFFHLAEVPLSGNIFKGRVYAKRDASNNVAFGIAKQGATSTFTGFTYALNTTYLMVVKYTIVAGPTNDTVDLFINPTLGGAEPAATISAPDIAAADPVNIGAVALRQGAAANASTQQVDGIRVGTTWAEATAVPSITVTGGPLTFADTTVGGTSAEQMYTVSGANLTTDITVTAPSTDFQVSKTTGTGFGSSVTFTQVGGTVATQSVFVRFTPQSAGLKSGNVSNASTGATTQDVAVSGTGTAAVCGPQSTVYVDDNFANPVSGQDPDGAGPATNFGCDSFATIQGGVAGVTTGGTVIVNAGTYNGPQILINRTMSVLGAGLATTIIDGLGAAPPSAGLVAINPPLGDTGNVTFSGFTITNPGVVGSLKYAMFAKPLDPATTVTISNNKFLGSGDAGPSIFDLGIWIYRNRGAVVFDHNDITNVGGNKVLIEQPLNSTNVHHNTIAALGTSSIYFNFTYDAENITTLQRVADNTINGSLATAINFNPSSVNVAAASRHGKYSSVQITGNVITQLGAARSAIALLNDSQDPTGADGAVESPIISGNIITGTNAGTSNGIRFRGLITNASITNNDIRNTARGFFGEPPAGLTHTATGTQLHVNNIVGNTSGMDWSGSGTIDAENNWWGCSFGPGVGGTGCSGTANGLTGTGAGLIDANPWLVLGVSAATNPVNPAGGTSNVTADMTDNSVAADTTGSGTVPLTPVAFSAGGGTMAPPTATITGGVATSVYTSNSALNGFACALVDSQTTCTPIMKNGATAASGAISGRITDGLGRPVSGAVVRLNGGQTRKMITDANGDYHFENVPAADFYTVTPTRANFGFNPAQRSFSVLGNKTEALFTGVFSGESANPLDTAEYFVRQQYLDVLGREPDEAGFNYWSDQLNQCSQLSVVSSQPDCLSARRIDVAAAFFIEREFQVSGAYIYNVYSGGLGRRPGFTEYAADRQQVVGGAEQAAFAASFVARAEFVAKYEANTTAEAFVAALLANVQQTAGVDLSNQRENLLTRYQTGATQNESRSLVLRGIAENAVFKRAQYNQAFVLTEYFSYLRRDADGPGFEFWLNVLQSLEGQTPGNYRGMVCAFMTAAEYQQRFSTLVTHSNNECAGR